MPDITDFPKPQRITFWYYLGVVHFLEGKYEEVDYKTPKEEDEVDLLMDIRPRRIS